MRKKTKTNKNQGGVEKERKKKSRKTSNEMNAQPTALTEKQYTKRLFTANTNVAEHTLIYGLAGRQAGHSPTWRDFSIPLEGERVKTNAAPTPLPGARRHFLDCSKGRVGIGRASRQDRWHLSPLSAMRTALFFSLVWREVCVLLDPLGKS